MATTPDSPDDSTRAAELPPVDLAAVPGAGGVVWSVSPGGFHTNLVVLAPGDSIGEHRNDALDVLVVVLAGAGTATIDGGSVALAAAHALLVRRGSPRAFTAGDEGLRYLTVHAERGPMTIDPRRNPRV